MVPESAVAAPVRVVEPEQPGNGDHWPGPGPGHELVDTARQQATSQISTQQQRLAGTLSTVATALQQAGREMRNQDEGPIADYVDTAANQVEQFANMLRDQDLEQLMTTTAQFARRQPALFLGAAFALGFAATRFIKLDAGRQRTIWFARLGLVVRAAGWIWLELV